MAKCSQCKQERETADRYCRRCRAAKQRGYRRRFRAYIDRLEQQVAAPIPMILYCPQCHAQHVDKAEPDVCESCGGLWADHQYTTQYSECRKFKAWLNPPHKKHRCHNCNHVWQPSLRATTGVEVLTPE